eukprot:4725978-Prymnesium_polylepis.1
MVRPRRDHVEAIGKRRRGSGRPNVICGREQDFSFVVFACCAIISVHRRVPVQALILLDVARVPRRRAQVVVLHLRSQRCLRTIECVYVVAQTRWMQQSICSYVSEREKVHLDAGGQARRRKGGDNGQRRGAPCPGHA